MTKHEDTHVRGSLYGSENEKDLKAAIQRLAGEDGRSFNPDVKRVLAECVRQTEKGKS